MSDALHPERATLKWRLLHDVVVPVLAGATVITAWPVVLPLAAANALSQRRRRARAEAVERGLVVERRHLLQPTTRAEIEQRERVVDPLGAVPDQPFGHLHAAWSAFAAQIEPGDALWSFSADVPASGGRGVRHTGYAVLRGRRVRARFVVERRGPVEG